MPMVTCCSRQRSLTVNAHNFEFGRTLRFTTELKAFPDTRRCQMMKIQKWLQSLTRRPSHLKALGWMFFKVVQSAIRLLESRVWRLMDTHALFAISISASDTDRSGKDSFTSIICDLLLKVNEW